MVGTQCSQNSSIVDVASLLTEQPEQPEQRMSFGDERMLEAYGATLMQSEGADRDDE